MKFRYTRRATSQIASAFDQIKQNDPHAATRFLDRIETVVRLAARHPEIGRRTDAGEIRVIPLRPF